METNIRGRRWATRAAAGIAGAGLLAGTVAPIALADDSVTVTPPSVSQQVLQAAVDKAQQKVVDARAALDAAKAAEAKAYADLDSATQSAIDKVTVAAGVLVAAKTAFDTANDLYEAAKKAAEDAEADRDLLREAVEQAKQEVERTKVDGKDALDIVAADWAQRVLPAEANKLLRCTINVNSQACKDATAKYDAAVADHDEFAGPHKAAADAYSRALTALLYAEARLLAAESGLGSAALDALKAARDTAEQAWKLAQQNLLDTVGAQAERLGKAGLAVGEAELVTEVKRGKFRAAKAILADLMEQLDTSAGDGTAEDIDGVVPEDVTAGDGTASDNMGMNTPDNPEASPPADVTPPVEVTPPGQVKPEKTIKHKVVYSMKGKDAQWTVVGKPGSIPRSATVTIHTAASKKASNLQKAKAKAKRVATAHKATYAGMKFSKSLNKARVVVTWTATS